MISNAFDLPGISSLSNTNSNLRDDNKKAIKPTPYHTTNLISLNIIIIFIISLILLTKPLTAEIMTHHAEHQKINNPHGEDLTKKTVHILPVDASTNDPTTDPKLTGEVPSKLSDDGLAAVFAQPGPVIQGDQLGNQEVISSEELDRKAEELNKNKPHHK
ncbi:hypothetical protein PPACK8108_LOCUS21872 [Phakopsora pachyrhizi]|uniref:Uncharacterized protein n=1 Tax=Phakopsora pachyrhizi TaxID=170000 RepID=A0AAV0BMF1_PHAPC|nr:hypothetical protein PPACK8108_LOCUS21872 [Phakopsora pachyrhizi]